MPGITIEYTGNVVTNAFHGTSRESADTILKDGFRVSRDKNLFFGDGVYFFQGSPKEAYNFAANVWKYNPAVVLRSEIQLSRCLDLDTIEHRELIEFLEEELLNSRAYTDVSLRFVINYLAEITTVHSVKKTVLLDPNPPHFIGSRGYSYTRTIIAVRKVSIIADTAEHPNPGR